MPNNVRVTPTVAAVLAALLAEPDAEHYGLDLVRRTGLSAGTLYPILMRLRRAEWVEATWEDIDPHEAGRPARRYYRLTPHGAATARSELRAMYQRLSIVPGIAGESPA
ncbi:MAG TPA: helix-turn-helix transcriptional regulator [Stackebrandtia sp.]|jgi:DNA-binding PadR family transcriptional regulator|uniref:PadR family transcriptional regulator n=1 Tax=Stackebrandtia sp. TaxID=2023065 RepID=UPI002D5A64C0|nr:helix-turn-helix transcriptional regulator [Stackebrandtia sp.]HZE41615.1 helix-turn-helix transcriptional regulator [Stackebrandtia sp.]